MPPRTRKRKASAESQEPEEPAAQKKATRAPRKPPQRQRKTSIPAADTQNNAMFSFFDQSSTARNKKVQVNEVKKQIQKQGDEIVKFIEQQFEETSSGFDKALFDEELPRNLLPVLPWMAPSTNMPNDDVETLPQASVKAAMDEFQGIIDKYEALNNQDTGVTEQNWMRWEQDASDLATLNSYAMRFATQTVNHGIMPGPHPASIKPPEHGDDLEKMAWELAEDGRPKATEETWGMVAQEQVKAITRCARLLPENPDSMGSST